MIKRELYLSKIRKFIDKEEIKAITGVRRCGKTCLLKQIIDELEKRGVNNENILYVSLESSKYDNIKDYVDLNEYIFKQTENLKGKIYLLFDEIQLVSNWEKSINAYRIDLNCDIYIHTDRTWFNLCRKYQKRINITDTQSTFCCFGIFFKYIRHFIRFGLGLRIL